MSPAALVVWEAADEVDTTRTADFESNLDIVVFVEPGKRLQQLEECLLYIRC